MFLGAFIEFRAYFSSFLERCNQICGKSLHRRWRAAEPIKVIDVPAPDFNRVTSIGIDKSNLG